MLDTRGFNANLIAIRFQGRVVLPSRDTSAEPRDVGEAATDTKAAATVLLRQALTMIDNDPSIPLFVGSHLQMAMDSLWLSRSTTSQDLQ